MSNPFLVQVPFAYSGNKNPIQIERQAGQDDEDATYKTGFPPITMIQKELGGLPPKGLDFNGIFYELSSPIAHYCKGGRIYFDQDYANAIGGYPKGHIITANDDNKDYISLVNNNKLDPNTNNITGFWRIYAGSGSVPTATSTTTGTVKLKNNLTSNDVDAALTAAQGKKLQDEKLNKTDVVNTLLSTDASKALSAAQGKVLNDKMLGVEQSWQDVTEGRVSGTLYTNNTGRPIQVLIQVLSQSVAETNILQVGGLTIIDGDLGVAGMVSPVSFIVPNNTTYKLTTSAAITKWSELR